MAKAAIDDINMSDADSKENEFNKINNSNVGKLVTPSKTIGFNSFGRYKKIIETQARYFEEAVDAFISSNSDVTSTNKSTILQKRKPETTQVLVELKKLQGSVRNVANTTPTAVPCTLTCLIPQFLKLFENIDNNLSNARSVDVMIICQNVADFVKSIGANCPQPYGSNLLEEWSPLLEKMLSSNVSILIKCCVDLWKNTFGTVQGKLRYPNANLRKILVELPKKYNILIPQDEECPSIKDHDIQSDDEVAMDGIQEEGGTAQPLKKNSSFEEMSFELSQQPNIDALAERLMCEKVAKKNSPLKTVQKKKASKSEKILDDEDTRDFVVIKTPNSGKKNQLTDRQREKFEESRDGINYVNEESQSGTQKEHLLKKALSEFNFAMDSESNSVEASQNAKNTSPVSSEPPVAKKGSLKRPRRLFQNDDDETPVKLTRNRSKRIALNEEKASECSAENTDSAEESSQELIALPVLESSSEAVVVIEKKYEIDSVVSAEDEKKWEEAVSRSQSKKQPNPKKYTAGSKEVTPRRRSTRNGSAEVKPVEVKPTIVETEVEKAVETKDEPEKMEEKIEIPQTPTSKKVPKMATTPSILRKTPSAATPMTERKRNRVHFGADSLPAPCEEIKKVASPLKESSKGSPSKSIEQSSQKSSIGTFPGLDYDPEKEIIYPGLKDCEDHIDLILRKLTPHAGAISATSILKKSFSVAGIKTVGQFASLSIAQVNKINGIRQVREKTARKALSEYEANRRMIMKYSSVTIVEEKEEEVLGSQEKKEILESEEKKDILESQEKKDILESQEKKEILESQEKKEVPESQEKKEVSESQEKKEVSESQEKTDILEIQEKSPAGSEKMPETSPIEDKVVIPEAPLPMETDDSQKSEVVEPREDKDNDNDSVTTDIIEESSNQGNMEETQIINDCADIDAISRRLCRSVAKSQITEEVWNRIDDQLFDAFVRLRGIVRDRGFKNV